MNQINPHTSQAEPYSKEKYLALQADFEEFAYIVSHDLKAPIRAILSLIDFLEEDLGSNLDEDSRSNFDLLQNRSRRLDRMMKGILEYSRAGRSHDKLELLQIEQVIEEAVSLVDSPSKLNLTIDSQLPPLTSSVSGLRTVFFQLLSNAADFCEEDEVKVSIRCTSDNDFYQFTVTDDGVGIDPKFHQRVFSIFQTLAPRDVHEKVGVGLPIAKKIVTQLGGTIQIQSDGINGTAVIFTIPK